MTTEPVPLSMLAAELRGHVAELVPDNRVDIIDRPDFDSYAVAIEVEPDRTWYYAVSYEHLNRVAVPLADLARHIARKFTAAGG